MRRRKLYDFYFPRLSNKKDERIIATLVVLAVIAVSFAYGFLFENKETISENADVEFHFIDIGQGDASLIITDEVFVLVDAGPGASYNDLYDYVSEYTDTLDCVVFSHAHEDHMGGAQYLLRDFTVKNILMTGYTSDSEYYTKTLDEVEEKSIPVTEALPQNSYKYGDLCLEVLAPITEKDDANNNSIIMRAIVDGVSVLYTGDAEKEEYASLSYGYDTLPESTILKVGHHGSSNATHNGLLNAVSPEYAVISCEKGNSYGHPHSETIELLENADIPYYRTDKNGDIVFIAENGKISVKCDGKEQ